MKEPIEDRLQELLASRTRADPEELERLRAYVRVLPPRRRPQRFGALASVAAVLLVVVIGGGALALTNGLGGQSGAWVPESPVPIEGDPAGFVSDPRFLACTGAAQFTHASGAFATTAFEIDHARDYRRHLPAMGLSPELDVDDRALIVVFEVVKGPPPPVPTTAEGAQSPPPSEPTFDVCVVVGADPNAGRNYYPEADVSGLVVNLGPASPAPSGLGSVHVTIQKTTVRSTAAIQSLELWRGLVLVGALPAALDEVTWAGLGSGTYELRYSQLVCGVGCDRLAVGQEQCGRRFDLDPGTTLVARLALDGDPGCVIEWDASSEPRPTRSASPSAILPADASWFDPDGLRQTATRTFPGPGHCGWESTVWLSFGGDTYFRDPLGVLSAYAANPYREDDAIPSAASDTGLRSAYWHLFGQAGWDEVYMLTPDGTIEVWARDRTGLGCS